MGRIRTIKPEFWASEQITDCSPNARLLFIGMWNFCDDRGIHSASIKRLKMEVFPTGEFSEAETAAMIQELLDAKLLAAYEVGGEGYWQVTGWKKHQKIEKPTYKHPPPPSEKPAEKSPENSLSSRGQVAEDSPNSRRDVADASPDPRPRNGMESKGSKPMSGKPDAVTVLDYLNEKTGKNFRPVKSTLNLIDARLKEGATVDECRAVIDAKVREWQNNSKMCKYLRPETLFGATKFAGYLGQLSDGNTGSDWMAGIL